MKISKEQLCLLIEWVRYYVFPNVAERPAPYDAQTMIGEILRRQISVFPEVEDAQETVNQFIDHLPELSRIIHTDVKAVRHNDPAVRSTCEVVLCYPVVTVMLHYRTAHRLYQLGVPILPRMIAELAHSQTGVDIHPAAEIGEYFAFDHGTGIVIGATSVIGNHVMLYQGVTLGARNFQYTEDGDPMDIPRHPILEDNVTVYSNSSLLGRIRIGHDTIIGGNVWLTHDVPPESRILQGRAIEQYFCNGSGI